MSSERAGHKARIFAALVVVFALLANDAVAGVNVKMNEDFIKAANRGDLPAVKRFIAKGADVNARDNVDGTALMFASYNGHKDVVKLLLDKGADCNAKGMHGVTALLAASQNGHAQIVQALLAKGADVNAKANHDVTALILASQDAHPEIVQALLAKGADVNAKDEHGETALIHASRNGHEDVVELLLANGADVNVKDNTGKTALTAASQNGHPEIAQALLAKGPDAPPETTVTSTQPGAKQEIKAVPPAQPVSVPPTTAVPPPQTATGPLSVPVILKEGGTAYVRVKQYSTLSGEPTVKDSSGGVGHVLTTFSFGDNVTLIKKERNLPTYWLVAKGLRKVWIPAHILTSKKAEIDFLKDKNKIPETMSFIYSDSILKVWGVVKTTSTLFHIDSHSVPMSDYPEGTSPFALKGNAVLFDESAAKSTLLTTVKPAVFNGAKKAFQLSPTCLYYCVSDGDKPAFECIDLDTLTIQQ